MAFNRPTLPQLIERIASDIESRMAGTDPRLRRAVLGVLARTLAGAAHGLHGHLDWLAKQVIPDTAEAEILDRWASWWGVSRKAAAAATGEVTFTGNEGATIPAGTSIQRSDGIEYTTDAEGTITGGTATVAVTAASAGQDTSAAAGVSLSLVSPVAGVQSAATVAAGGLTGGADEETDAALRERLRSRVQNPPHGGSEADYEAWALEVEGVTRVWAFPQWTGDGTVGLFFVRDDDADFIPDAAEVAAVQDYVDALRPVTAALTCYAPTAVAVDMTIQLSPNTASVQAAVQAELEDLLRREAGVEDGAGSGTVLLSHIREAISRAEGETDHVLVSPAADVTLSAGEIATLGNLTFQAL